MKRFVFSLFLFFILGMASVHASLVYSNDFETGSTSGWTLGSGWVLDSSSQVWGVKSLDSGITDSTVSYLPLNNNTASTTSHVTVLEWWTKDQSTANTNWYFGLSDNTASGQISNNTGSHDAYIIYVGSTGNVVYSVDGKPQANVASGIPSAVKYHFYIIYYDNNATITFTVYNSSNALMGTTTLTGIGTINNTQIIGQLSVGSGQHFYLDNVVLWSNLTQPPSSNLTISVNDTRANALLSSFSYNYTSNVSDPGANKNYYCSSTSCSVTNYTGTLNITVFNVSAGTYFNPVDSTKNYVYNSSQNTYTFSTWQNSINVNVSNVVNGSYLSFCLNWTNSTYSAVGCNSTGNTITLYNVSGTVTLTYYDVGSGDGNPGNALYYNVTQGIGAFNSTNANYTNTTYQALLNISVFQLFTNLQITNFNVTNNLATNKTPGTNSDLIPANNGTNNIQIDVGGNYSKNYSVNATDLATISYNATGIYDNLFTIAANFSGSSVSNFTVNVTNSTLGGLLYSTSTTTGNITFPLLQGYYYNFYMNPPAYSTANNTMPANSSTNYYNFTLFQMNTVNFTFYDEQNGTVVNTTNITLNMISNPQSATYSTLNGTIITNIMTPATYLLQYSAAGYATRTSTLTIVNQTYSNVRLPMLQSSASTTVTVTVVDNTGTLLKNATVTTYKYDITTNTYLVNQIMTTNDQGVGTISVQLNNILYYFTVNYQGSIQLITTPNFIYSNTIQLTVPVSGGGFSDLFNNQHLIGIISNSTPVTYSFLWTDSDNTAASGCLYAFQFQNNGLTLYNNTCANSSGGTVTTTINNNTNLTYYLYGVVTKNGQQYTMDTRIVSFGSPPPTENSTRMWLFVMLVIMVIIVIIFRDNPSISVIGAGLVPLLFSAVHLTAISIGFTIPVFIICVIIGIALGF